MNTNELEERRLLLRFLLELGRGVVLLLLQIPLVHHDDQAASALPGKMRDLQILVVQALRGIEHEDADVGALDRAPRSERGIEFDAILHLRLATESRGVDEDQLAPVKHHGRINRVAGSSSRVGDDQPFLAEKSVDDGRLADVGAAHYRHAQCVGHFFRGGWDLLHQHVEHVAGILAVDGRDGNRIPGA